MSTIHTRGSHRSVIAGSGRRAVQRLMRIVIANESLRNRKLRDRDAEAAMYGQKAFDDQFARGNVTRY